MMTLYHGSYLSVPAPLTGVGRRELDFGVPASMSPASANKPSDGLAASVLSVP